MRLPRPWPGAVERAPGTRIARHVELRAEAGARIVLGPSAVIGAGCRLHACAGALIQIDGELGAGCRLIARQEVVVAAGARLADRCALIDFDHTADDPDRPIRQQGLRAAPVRVEAGALLGPGVVVLRGTTVGARATVLANSVITRDVPPEARAAGIPARVVLGGGVAAD